VFVDWTRGGAEAAPIRQAMDMNKIETNKLSVKVRLAMFIGDRIITRTATFRDLSVFQKEVI